MTNALSRLPILLAVLWCLNVSATPSFQKELTELRQEVSSLNAGLTSERRYVDLLEKTNLQLGLWTNPYGVLIGALAVLFTAGAVITAIIMFRQERVYKDALDKERNSYRAEMDRFLEAHRVGLEEMKKTYQEYVTSAQKIDAKLQEQMAKAGDEKERIRLQAERNRLEIQKAELQGQLATAAAGATMAPFQPSLNDLWRVSTHPSGVLRCPHCSFEFKARLPLYATSGLALHCPACGKPVPV